MKNIQIYHADNLLGLKSGTIRMCGLVGGGL